MKKETAEERLNKLLGIDPELIEREKKRKAALEANRTGKIQGITEEEIQNFREMQGIVYFLQAPALFQSKTCPNCKIPFMVSRLFVAYCSYDCIRESLRHTLGTDWEKGNDLEALAIDPRVYDGNEPIWIRNLSKLKEILESISYEPSESSEKENAPQTSESLPIDTSPPVVTSSPTTIKSRGRRVISVK